MKMTLRQTRQTIWIVCSAITMATCIRGVAWGVEFDANVFRFLVWLSCPATILASMIKDVEAKIKKLGPPLPPILMFMVDLMMACICAGCTWFGYAGLIGVAALCQYSTYTDYEPEPEATNND
jgi:hypothetical protein